MKIPSLLAILTAGALLASCQSTSNRIKYNPKLPTATEVHQFEDSEHFQGFRYNPLSQVLTVIAVDGRETNHFHVPVAVAQGFATDGGHLGYYLRSIADRYHVQEKISADGRMFLPVPSSLFSGVDYDPERRRLYLLNTEGRVTEYINVPPEVYRGFLDAPIKGSYFYGYIQNVYEDARIVAQETSPAETAP
jgi:hypothetical protein